MYKKIASIAILLVGLAVVYGQDKPVLRFNPDGKFKIVQFTDVHLKYKEPLSDSAMVMMKKIIEMEQPDLIMLTGDIVCTENTKEAWDIFSKILIDSKTPWAYMIGNHDDSYDMTRQEVVDYVSKMPYSLTEEGPEDIRGYGNYVLEVKASRSDETAALCYVFDSGTGIPRGSIFGSYEWIDHSLINWYKEQSTRYTQQNEGVPYPALAFFHIPLPEYDEKVDSNSIIGIREEYKFGGPDLNSGMYTTMIECKDVMGTFVGHDHNNDYLVNLRGICLAYGNVSGGNSYGKIGRGARIIELYEGERKFDTWVIKLYDCVREKNIWTPRKDNGPKFFVSYPGSFE